MNRPALIAGLLLALSCYAQPERSEQRTAMERPRGAERAARMATRGTRGAVAAGTDFAADAGMRLFLAGGNAVDAGVAAMFAAAVAEYSHFAFGGEAPILIRTRGGEVKCVTGLGPMPKLATAEFFRTRKMKPGEIGNAEPGGLKAMVPAAGVLPALVPGMIDGGLLALREFGTKSFADVIAPAIELAEGMPMDETRAGSIGRARKFFELWPSSKSIFLPGGKPPVPGDIFRQTDLARTLRSMAEAESRAHTAGRCRTAAIDAVRDHFYRGDIARRIDAFSRANDGLLRYEDLAAFRAEIEAPVSATYRGATVYKPGFWSQGPSMLQALNILEGYDLKAMGLNSADYIHTLIETLKLVYADRDTYYGDPKFGKVPAERLLSKEYAAERRKQVGAQASMEFRPGLGGRHPSQSEVARARVEEAYLARDTTCVVAWDRDGNVFSATPSGAWLPAVAAGDTGILLGHRAQSFLLIPGHPNELAGGKRPRITLSPTLVVKDGQPILALSTPGGDNQDQSLLQVLLDAVEFGMNPQQAVEAPRVQTRHLVSSFDNHAMLPGDLLLDERVTADTVKALAGRGHKTQTRSRFASGAAPVMIRILGNGMIEAGADPYGYRAARAW
ncbi:MAG: gamma-glutamyltransferase family protein [Bryobacterales bacterium]|nr:gamma-glutamyltransferase family protein [Bryobacterales bacterium]